MRYVGIIVPLDRLLGDLAAEVDYLTGQRTIASLPLRTIVRDTGFIGRSLSIWGGAKESGPVALVVNPWKHGNRDQC